MSKFRTAFPSTKSICGQVLCVDKSTIWLAHGRRLMLSSDHGQTWKQRAVLPIVGIRELLASHSLGRRLGRVGFHHLEPTGEDITFIIAHRHIFGLLKSESTVDRAAPLVGSRPLKVCVANGFVYYGEYRSNTERSPVHVWAAKVTNLRTWKPVWQFETVRHIHGVFFDPYTTSIWITTGDEDNESAIWVTRDQFQTLDVVVHGSQQHRAVQLLFGKTHIYFASDAPEEVNHIYCLDRRSGSVERLATVGGPVFHGCKVGDHLFFSTVVEPSNINRQPYAEVWGSPNGEHWRVVCRYRKDWLPKKLFQYGQVKFPSGPGDDEHLWLSPMSTDMDQQTIKIDVRNIF